MKQISQNYKTGAIKLEEVDVPAAKSGGVLVQTSFSVISAGTEGMKAREGKLSYVGKAKARPDQVKKVMQSVQQQGLKSTYEKVMNKLDSLTPLGYSLSGVVMDVLPGAEGLQVGQRVACAGAGYANHAEINFVPKNLVVPVPDNLAMEHAAFATIGAISMQGFRQAEMQLGETACVIGLGLLGQLLVQILKASGVNVIGIDLQDSRCELATSFGASYAAKPDAAGVQSAIKRLTNGMGVDCSFITAGGNTNAPVEFAVDIARDRGRIVDIGKTKLDLMWNDFYEKELDVRFSRSYGPGRYDPNYEEGGIDYPIGYVRWTEQRNMSSFLQLVADKKVLIDPIITSVKPFSEAEEVYNDLVEKKDTVLGIVFKHAENVSKAKCLPEFSKHSSESSKASNAQQVGIGVIGAGNYASSMLLPHLAKIDAVKFKEVSTATSLSSANAARKFNFERTTTDYKATLNAADIQAVLIATRHSAHASMVAEALETNKSVYVEKPLAISLSGLKQVKDARDVTGNSRLMVGFNRRFSPLVKKIIGEVSKNSGPLTINYRVHAGQMEHGSWYLDSSHGTRFVGEAGHFFDLFSAIIQARPISVMARSLRPKNITQDDIENVSALVNYADGSVANLTYLTQGGAKLPKEYIEVFGGGRTMLLNNFENIVLYDEKSKQVHKSKGLDKGQSEEMNEFISCVMKNNAMPISFEDLFDTTLLTLAAAKSLGCGQVVELAEFWDTEQ